jgi:UrcA family protein
MPRNCFTMQTAYVSATLATILASHGAIAAPVEPHYEVSRRIVRFADLDITRSAGAATLYARITTAAREVCEPSPSRGELGFSSQTRQCQEQAIERAVTDVNAPALTSYHLIKVKSAGDRK